MTNPTPPNNNAADAFATREPVDAHDGWMDRLERSKYGDVRATFANLCDLIEHDSLTHGKLWRNLMDGSACLEGERITDVFLNTLRERYSRPTPYGAEFPTHEINRAVDLIAAKQSRHPVREWLSSLRWDGVPRLSGLCARVLGNHGQVQARMVRMWMVSAVARAFRPGCQVDTMLVLQGKQGARKSTFFAELGGEWFTDAVQELDARSLEVAHKYWVCELAELDGVTRKSDVSRLKADITRRADDHHRKYAVRPENSPRGFVFCASVNSQEFLSDETGSRRFWIVSTADSIDTGYIRAERAQLWAEAVEAFRAGERWWFTREESEAAEDLAREFTLSDSREERVRQWLLSVSGDVTMRRVLVECLGFEDRGIDRKAETAVGLIMRRLGWYPRRVRRGDAQTRVYERKESPGVPTNDAGWSAGRSTNGSSENAIVPTSPTSPTKDGQSSSSDGGSDSSTSTNYLQSLGTEVGTDGGSLENSHSRRDGSCSNLIAAEVGTDPTAQPANDDEQSETAEVDSDDFDPSVYVERPDGTIEVVHQGRGRAR